MRFLVLLLAAMLGACTALEPGVESASMQAFRASEHPGSWIARGYGHVIDAGRDRVRFFHHAGAICVEEDVASSVLESLDRYRIEGRVLHLRSELDPYVYTFDRADGLPAACAQPAPDTPPSNYEAFAALFARHFAFFDVYGVDWPARVREGRRKIGPATTDRELFDVMREVSAPLRDAHLRIAAKIGGEKTVHVGNPGDTARSAAAWGASNGLGAREANSRLRRAYWVDDIGRDLLGGQGKRVANDRIQYGMIGGDIGLLAIVTMGGFAEGSDSNPRAEGPVLEAAMQQAITLFNERGARAVIVDVSLNQGGHDFVSRAIAGRFAPARALAFTKRAGDDPTSKPQPIHVEPSVAARFTGPVYVLTSDSTVSAGESFVLALRALPNATHVGQRTRGAFSDVLSKYLPNGWELSISNEIYVDADGRMWEGRGIEPDIPLPVFDPGNPLRGHLDAVRAVEKLAREGTRRMPGPRR